MKKAKIMLTAIAVFAVVGGAMAFKAMKFNQDAVYTTTAAPASGVTCNLGPILTSTTTSSGTGHIYASKVKGGLCVTFTTVIE